LKVNFWATFSQLGGKQIVGPTGTLTIFPSKQQWVSGLDFIFLGKLIGLQGLSIGSAILCFWQIPQMCLF